MSAAQTSTARTAKHTQGPWHVPGLPMAPDNFVVTTKDGDSICDCSPAGPWVSFEEAEANARMCAAAPDLVAAAELFSAAAYEVRDLLNSKGIACPASIMLAAEKARAALASTREAGQ